MNSYYYIAIDKTGEKQTGFLSSDNEKDVFKVLLERKLKPISIKKSRVGTLKSFFGFNKKVNIGDSFYYIGMMIKSGSTLIESLSLIEQIGPKNNIWGEIKNKIESGMSFSDVLSNYPDCFSSMYVSMVEISEKTGELSTVLEEIAKYEQNVKELKGKTISAITYPFIVFLVGIFAIYFMLTQIAPKMIGVFSSSKVEIPLTTKIIFGLGAFFEDYGVCIAFLFLTFLLLIVYNYKNNKFVKSKIDLLFWKFSFVKLFTLSRFSKMLGFQLEAGVSMVESFKNASKVSSLSCFTSKIVNLSNQIEQGESINKVITQSNIFPVIYIMAFNSGMKSGNLPLFLFRMGEIFEKELDDSLRKMVNLIEPITILGLGLVIGFFVMSIMFPIFDMSTLI